MTRALYIIGGTGTGKSTLLADVLGEGAAYSAQYTVATGYDRAGRKAPLPGHRVEARGAGVTYLGVQRDRYPGLDGTSRLSYLGFNAWALGGLDDIVVAEGRALLNRKTLSIFNTAADLLLVHLVLDGATQEEWISRRGYAPDPKHIREATTRSATLAAHVRSEDGRVEEVDPSDPVARQEILDAAIAHLWRADA